MHHWKVSTAATLLACASAISSAIPAYAAVPQQARIAERVAATQQVGFDVYLPIQHRAELEQFLKELHTAGSANYQKWLTPAQFHERFGASTADLELVRKDLEAQGMTVTEPQPRHLHVAGDAGAVERILGTELHAAVVPSVVANGKPRVAATSQLTLPQSLQRLHAVVMGLSANVHMQKHSVRMQPQNRYSPVGPYWFTDLKQAYKFPSYKSLAGDGAHVAILMTGDFNQPDMDAYFGFEGLRSPQFKRVEVDGGAPYSPDNSFETHLDLQQSGGMAPRAEITLYNIPDLYDSSIADGLLQIVEDNRADVVSMSFGGAEAAYTAAYNFGVSYTDDLLLMDDLFAQGNAQGISFVASSGDSGGLAIPPFFCFFPGVSSSCGSYQPGVEFPASSPHVTGVGGTNLKTRSRAGSLDSSYVSESAFYDPLSVDIFQGTPATGAVWGSGGGNSIVFRKPDYQYEVVTGNANVRTVPDVAGHEGGCPGGAVSCSPDDSADLVAIGGYYYGVIGTSASAPDFAGLLALTVERFGGRMGNANEYIYALSLAQSKGLVKNVYNWGIPGNNGVFSSGNKGYNRVLGNGTVNGANFMLAPQLPLAGVPRSPSNP